MANGHLHFRIRHAHRRDALFRKRRQRVAPKRVHPRHRHKRLPGKVHDYLVHSIGCAAGLFKLRPNPRFVDRAARRFRNPPSRFRRVRAVRHAGARGRSFLYIQLRPNAHRARGFAPAFPRLRHLRFAHHAHHVSGHACGIRHRFPGSPAQLHGDILARRRPHGHRVLRKHIGGQNDFFRVHRRTNPAAPVRRTRARNQRSVHNALQIAVRKAAAVENLPKRFPVRVRHALAVQRTPIRARDHGHILRPLQATLDLQAGHARVCHVVQQVDSHQILRRQKVPLRLRRPGQPVRQTARLRAHAAVSAAPADHAGKQALSGAGHAQRAVREYLNLNALVSTGANLFKRHLARQHRPVETALFQLRCALPVVNRHLRGRMQRQARQQLAQRLTHAEVLHNRAVRARARKRRSRLVQKRHFLLLDHGVHGHIHALPALVQIIRRPFQLVVVKISRASAGIQRFAAQIHGVRAVFHGRNQRFPVSRRR